MNTNRIDQLKQRGRYGVFGGQYVPETLMNALIELEEAYETLKNDPVFQQELSRFLRICWTPPLSFTMRKS
jgi:tryptophan synthase beta subunit